MTVSQFTNLSLNDVYANQLKANILVGEIVQFPIKLDQSICNILKLMLCDGSTYDPNSYTALNSVISNKYGSSGSLHRVPNLMTDTITANTHNYFNLKGRENYNQIANSISGNNSIGNNHLPHSHNMDSNHQVTTNMANNFDTSTGYDVHGLSGFRIANTTGASVGLPNFNNTANIKSHIDFGNSNFQNSQDINPASEGYPEHSHSRIDPSDTTKLIAGSSYTRTTAQDVFYTPPSPNKTFQYQSIDTDVTLNGTPARSIHIFLKHHMYTIIYVTSNLMNSFNHFYNI